MNIAYHHPVKGVDVLLEAMAILVKEKKYNNMVLYQIGGSHTEGDTDKLRRLASDLAIDNNIVWLGLRNDVPMLLTAGDLYIQPSRSEGVPLSIMEADMARLPIAATNVGGNSEAAIDGVNATVVPPENPIELANAIEKLYLDASMRSRYGNMGHEIATQKFNIQTSVNKLIKCYYSL
jgi:glycosyltransferase involved in cell wall biosynthesis